MSKPPRPPINWNAVVRRANGIPAYRKLTMDENIEVLRMLLERGLTVKEIAERLKVGPATAYRYHRMLRNGQR